MDVTPLIPEGKKLISGYGDGGFSINREPVSGSILILPDKVIAWDATSTEQITTATLAPILENPDDVEILLIGCGATGAPLSDMVSAACRRAGIAVDTMGTGAACRTFNVLLSEERRVAAALLAIA